jgi:uncharacterized GH25 family protein
MPWLMPRYFLQLIPEREKAHREAGIGFISAILWCLCIAPCQGHDFWIEPSCFHPSRGDLVGIRLRNGMGLVGDPFPRSFRHIARFTVTCAGNSQEVMGLEGADPAGLVQAQTEGLYLIAYESNPLPIDLAPIALQRYLGQEGLLVGNTGLSSKEPLHHPGIEWFTRCAKSVIRLGTAECADTPPQILGQIFEMVPLQDPTLLRLGDTFNVQLLFHGHPVSGLQVSALNTGNLEDPQVVRTNPLGRAKFILEQPGFWLIKSVNLIPGGQAEPWQSYWASLTFEIGF